MTRPIHRLARVAPALFALALVPRSALAAEGESLCGPFLQQARVVQQAQLSPGAPIDERGVTPGGSAAPDPGEIVRLPAAAAEDSDAGPADALRESEAVLALPKDPSGAIPTGFELGPGARIRGSFFSPVVCATVARIAGPPGARIEQLVTVVPEGSALVPNDVYRSAATELEPVAAPDPYEPLQYSLALTGVRAMRALGDGEGVRVALLDSAPEIAHQDLSDERVRALPTQDGASAPAGVHGTLMAGVISATEGNGFGIAGVAPGAELVSVPVCTPSGSAGGRCTIYQLLQGLDRAWDAEAHVVNLSLSGPPNLLLERGVARLEELGAVVVAAAGNEGTDEARYPAAYPTVIGVGAIDREGQTFSLSNRGDWVELAAPGVDVLSTVPGNAFAFGNGTSLAAAHVSGVLAVLTSVTRDVKLARAELFRAANSAPRGAGRAPTLPTACAILARLRIDCEVAPTREPLASGTGSDGRAGPARRDRGSRRGAVPPPDQAASAVRAVDPAAASARPLSSS